MRLRYFITTLFILLAMAPLVVFRAWPHSSLLDNELEEVHERHLLLARNLASNLDRYVRDVETTFHLFLKDIEKWGASSADGMLANLSYRHICVADAETGRVVNGLSVARTPCPEVVPATRFAELSALARTGVTTFSGVRRGPDGSNVVYLVRRQGDRIAIGAIDTSYLDELGKTIAFGARAHAAIVDHTGAVLAHPMKDWVAARRDISDLEPVRRMLSGEAGVETFHSPALESEMIAGYAPVARVGWGVMVPQPVAELQAKAIDAQRSAHAVMIVGAMLALIIAFRVSVLISRPLERITAVSRNIAEGRLDVAKGAASCRFMPSEFCDLQSSFNDMVTRLRENVGTINQLAFVDTVTDLANREHFRRQVTSLIEAPGAPQRGALFFLDLDGFKSINDTHGHDVGDQILFEVARRLRELIGAEPLQGRARLNLAADLASGAASAQPAIARLGGDEFAIYMALESEREMRVLASAVLKAVSDPYAIGDDVAHLGASIGIAKFPEHGATYATLLKAADTAMYAAKRAGKNCFVLFDHAMTTAAIQRNRLAVDLRESFERQEVQPYFQLQYDAQSLEVIGVEALARWRHPTLGVVEPAEFFGVAEEINMVSRIDKTVLRGSIAAMRHLHARGARVPRLSVNVSKQCIEDATFAPSIEALGRLPYTLSVELLESIYLDQIDARARNTLERLRRVGVDVELDDFGSGHASIVALRNLRPDRLKIDKRLVKDIDVDPEQLAMVRAIVEMGHALQISIVAEGVETAAQIRVLRDLGCDVLQGFYFARPMSLRELMSSDLLPSEPLPPQCALRRAQPSVSYA